MVRELKPDTGFSAVSPEPALGPLSPSLWFSPTHALSLSKIINIKKPGVWGSSTWPLFELPACTWRTAEVLSSHRSTSWGRKDSNYPMWPRSSEWGPIKNFVQVQEQSKIEGATLEGPQVPVTLGAEAEGWPGREGKDDEEPQRAWSFSSSRWINSWDQLYNKQHSVCS